MWAGLSLIIWSSGHMIYHQGFIVHNLRLLQPHIYLFIYFLKFRISNLVRQRGEVQPHKICGAEPGGLKSSDDVLKSCCYNKVLLLQTQLLPFEKLKHK